jgi:uncharacterized Zn-binding protein involved in type VI secretion
MATNASREGDLFVTGHGCAGTSVLAIPPQNKVIINGRRAAVLGTRTVTHLITNPSPPPLCISHSSSVKSGSSKVIIAGIPATRNGDSVDAGYMFVGSPNVFIG